ncbi:single-stranded-DNA-specific exonuclease RecJ [Paenibacillus glufosinatiresistens]|uniref:single-stranded-DNA-specific exonuclease RecJ n=1 Tax=Paenibacillus glufosinatiresistens TaxID=3070657 RepID=UPI00286E5284|nr:single-stranded-DNA-specific exonuclease RecJ [Paenibacillus sp. YX.27]
MLRSKSTWKIPPADAAAAARLSKGLAVSLLMGQLLSARGITRPEDALSFMESEGGHDPFLLKGMKEAVPRIRRAIQEEEHILIYGDYDADGVSSTSLMIYLLRHLGASFDIYIPHRSNEGYGLHNHAIDWALTQGVSLIITVDTGISACTQIAYANERGIEVIVTDHHEPPEELPPAYALINPKLPGCPYPFKGLAGVGVAYKLAEALLDGDVPPEWTEIVAIGTVADLMPLTGENRALVRRGIESMRSSRFPGVRALLEVSGASPGAVNSVHIAFGMAPRINASGRLDHAGRAVSLLTAEHMEEAVQLAGELDMLNKERQHVVERITEEAVARLEALEALPPVIVLAGEGWNVGVVGIVASKILERYYRPVIILDIHPETGMCKGSARSIPGLDIYAALTSCRECMDHYGGHPAAAGMSLHRDRLEEFAAALAAYASEVLEPEHFVPVTETDGEIPLGALTLRAADELDRLAPFGMGNPLPRFVIRGAVVKEARTMGQGNRHLKLALQQGGDVIEAVAFGRGALMDLLPVGTSVDVLAELSVNEWNGMRKPQLMVQDLAVPEAQFFDFRGSASAFAKSRRLFELLQCGEPDRTAVAIVRGESARQGRDWEGFELWRYDNNGSLHPLQAGKKEAPAAPSLLCLLDMPESPEELEAIHRLFPEAENVALLHPIRSGRERLQPPSREIFKLLYQQLAALTASPLPEREVLAALCRRCSLNIRMVASMLDVFEELEFIRRADGQITFVVSPASRSLTTSSHYQRLGQMAEMERVFMEGSVPQLREWLRERLYRVSVS